MNQDCLASSFVHMIHMCIAIPLYGYAAANWEDAGMPLYDTKVLSRDTMPFLAHRDQSRS